VEREGEEAGGGAAGEGGDGVKKLVTVALLDVRLAVTVPEAAALLGVSGQTVARLIADGRLAGRNIASGKERKSYVIPVEALKSWLNGPKK
jgi:excisionase family DNA binding protein